MAICRTKANAASSRSHGWSMPPRWIERPGAGASRARSNGCPGASTAGSARAATRTPRTWIERVSGCDDLDFHGPEVHRLARADLAGLAQFDPAVDRHRAAGDKRLA